jgi:hypothetical protein
METNMNFNLPLTFQQIAEIVRRLPKSEQRQLAMFLQKEVEKDHDFTQTHFATEAILSQDWLNPEEEKAWLHL